MPTDNLGEDEYFPVCINTEIFKCVCHPLQFTFTSVDRFIFNLVYKHVYLFRIFLTVHVKNRNFSPISTRLYLSVCPFKSKAIELSNVASSS